MALFFLLKSEFCILVQHLFGGKNGWNKLCEMVPSQDAAWDPSMVSEFFWRNGAISAGDTFWACYYSVFIVAYTICFAYIYISYICIYLHIWYLYIHTINIKKVVRLSIMHQCLLDFIWRVTICFSSKGVPSMPGEGCPQSCESHGRSQTQSRCGRQKNRHRGSHPTSWSKG